MNQIAFRYGFCVETLWNLSENGELKKLRQDPNFLQAGDEVFVPDKRLDDAACATEKRHRFRRKGVPVSFKLRVEKDGSSEDYAGLPWRMVLDGTVYEGKLDDKGGLEIKTVPQQSSAKLYVGEGDDKEVFDLSIGGLDPVDTPRGAQQRLANLALYLMSPEDTWSKEAIEALKTFQRVYMLAAGEEPGGELDEKTCERLKEVSELDSETREEAQSQS